MTMILAIMYREFRIRITSLVWLFFDLLVPLTYLFLFGVAFNATVPGGMLFEGNPVSYRAFFLPGVLSMSSFGIALNAAYGFFVDRDNGIFYEFLTYPMTRAQFLIGKVLFSCLLGLTQFLATMALGALLLEVPLESSRLAAMAAMTIAGTAGWFFFLSIFALRIRRNDLYNTVINALYFVLMFASSIFYPTETMPAWLRIASAANPLTWHTDILRIASLGGAPDATVVPALLFTVFLFASFLAGVRTLRSHVTS